MTFRGQNVGFAWADDLPRLKVGKELLMLPPALPRRRTVTTLAVTTLAV